MLAMSANDNSALVKDCPQAVVFALIRYGLLPFLGGWGFDASGVTDLNQPM